MLPEIPTQRLARIRAEAPHALLDDVIDGRTPVANAEEVARTLPNARTLVIEGAAHGLFGAPGVTEALLEFLRER